jgi:hypothetical protein
MTRAGIFLEQRMSTGRGNFHEQDATRSRAAVYVVGEEKYTWFNYY